MSRDSRVRAKEGWKDDPSGSVGEWAGEFQGRLGRIGSQERRGLGSNSRRFETGRYEAPRFALTGAGCEDAWIQCRGESGTRPSGVGWEGAFLELRPRRFRVGFPGLAVLP